VRRDEMPQNESDAKSWRFMLRRLRRAAKHRQLSKAETDLVVVLESLLACDSPSAAMAVIGSHVAKLATSCADPLWKNPEED
jgi:hypothetical protein